MKEEWSAMKEGMRYIVKQGREWQEEVKKMEEEEMWKGLEHLEGGVEHPEGGSGWSLEREGQPANPVWCIHILLPHLILVNMHSVEASTKIARELAKVHALPIEPGPTLSYPLHRV